MASLVGKIKDKIRHRSDSSSSDYHATARSVDEREEHSETAHSNYATGNTPSHHYSSSPRVSLEHSAFHVHRGRKSLDGSRPNPPPKDDIPPVPVVPTHIASGSADLPGSTRGRTEQSNINNQMANFSTTDDGIVSSSAGHSASNTRGSSGNGVFEDAVETLVPERGSSRYAVPSSPETPKRKAVPEPQHRDSIGQATRIPYRISSSQDPGATGMLNYPANGQQPNTYEQPDGRSVTISRPEANSPRSKHLAADTPPSRDAATPGLHDSAQLASMYLQKSSDTTEKESMLRSGHLHLPEGFNLQDTEETHVYEEVRPAVTHETIIKERTEIVQEEITRDIHVHHYYTYAQPVKVVEVLPAKHYYLDLVTGVKTQIPAPKGWQLPVHMQPVAPDTSTIKSWTRHYLVDEAHPNGIAESPPLKHESGHDNLRHEAALAGKV